MSDEYVGYLDTDNDGLYDLKKMISEEKSNIRDNDPLEFRVYFGETTSPPFVDTITNGSREYRPALSADTRYFWKLVADDDHGNSTAGDNWTFRTE